MGCKGGVSLVRNFFIFGEINVLSQNTVWSILVDLVLQDYRCWSRGSGGKVEPGRCRAVGGSQGLVASSKRELGGRVDPSERSDERAWVWSGMYNQCPRKRAGSPRQQSSSLTLRNRPKTRKPSTMASTIAALNEEAAQIVYTPLEPGTVRLVHLHPASDLEAGVVCSLEHARLGGNPRYQALSYVWGSQDDPREICLSGTTVLVTQNLYNALRRLRLQHETRVIWVDALSINQSDIAERNVEVQVMRDIYSSAYETLAWLDESLGEEGESRLSTLTDPGYCPSSREKPRGPGRLYPPSPGSVTGAGSGQPRRSDTRSTSLWSQRVVKSLSTDYSDCMT